MVPKDYHSSIAIDLADHLRGLSSLLIDTASASGDDYLLFYHQDGPSQLWDQLMVPMDYYFSIAIDPTDHLRGLLLLLLIDIAPAGDDNYLLFSIMIDLANQ